MEDTPAIGIDLGGTKIHAGVVHPDGEMLGEARVPTEADRDAEAILASIVEAVNRALEEAGLGAHRVGDVGLGSPAPLDARSGVVSPVNLPTMHGFPVVARLSQALGKRVVLNNDANCFGLAEARFGAGVGAGVCCGLTLGTGLGGFLVFDGELYDGPRGAAVEVWASRYHDDHVEQCTNGAAVARIYHKLTRRNAEAQEITWLAGSGEAAALETYREYGRHLAVPVAWLCNVLDPDVVVLGGSVAKAWEFFSESLLHEARKYINEVNREQVRIVRGVLGEAAGVLGAAALVLPKRNR